MRRSEPTEPTEMTPTGVVPAKPPYVTLPTVALLIAVKPPLEVVNAEVA